MKKLNGKQMSEILSISPQAVNGLTTRGRLVRDNSGMYDLSNKENRSFLKERNIKISEIKIPETPAPGRPVVNRPVGKIKTPHNGIDKTQSELQKEYLQKRIAKLELERDIKLKKYLSTDFIEHFLFKYLESLNVNIERTASVGIGDFSKKIIDAGELTQAIRVEFTNLFLSTIHRTKQQIINEIKNYDPNSGGAK